MIIPEYNECHVDDPAAFDAVTAEAIDINRLHTPATPADFDEVCLAYSDKTRAPFYWADCLMTGIEMQRAFVNALAPEGTYNTFDAVKTTGALFIIYDNLPRYQISREYSCCVYIHSIDGTPLRLPTKEEQAALTVDEIDYYLRDGIPVKNIIRAWWD